MYNQIGRKSNFESFTKDKPEIEFVGNAEGKTSYNKILSLQKSCKNLASSSSLTRSRITQDKDKDSPQRKKKLSKAWTTSRNKAKEDIYAKELDCLAKNLVTKMRSNIKDTKSTKSKGSKGRKLKGFKEKGNSLSRNYSSTTDLEVTKKSIKRHKFNNKSPKMSPIIEEKKVENKDIKQEVYCHESPILQDISQAPIANQNKSDSDIDSIHQQFESIC